MTLANIICRRSFSWCVAALLLGGCDEGASSVSSTVTAGESSDGTGGESGDPEAESSDGTSTGLACDPQQDPIALEIEVDGFAFPFDNADVPCTVTEGGFDCDLEGTPTPLLITLDGVGALPWALDDDVLVTVSNGSSTIMHVLAVKDSQGLLLGLLIDGDPGFQTAVDIELSDASCVEGDNVLPLEATYALGDASLSILGAGEGTLDTNDGVYRVRQEAAGTALGNPDQPDFVTATVLLEG